MYYIQYAHARICRVFDKLAEKGLTVTPRPTAWQALSGLKEDVERELVKKLAAYPEVVQTAALAYEPHHVSNYLKELAAQFHGWYNDHIVLNDDTNIRNARLLLSQAVKTGIGQRPGIAGRRRAGKNVTEADVFKYGKKKAPGGHPQLPRRQTASTTASSHCPAWLLVGSGHGDRAVHCLYAVFVEAVAAGQNGRSHRPPPPKLRTLRRWKKRHG